MKKFLLIGFIILLVLSILSFFLISSKSAKNRGNSYKKNELNTIDSNQTLIKPKQNKYAGRQTTQKIANEAVYDETVYDDNNTSTNQSTSSDTNAFVEFHNKENKVIWTRNKITNSTEATNDEMTIVNPEDGIYYKPIR
jgi:hypothetical protein